METKNCNVCGKQMRYIKAGVSKNTGKPYDAFYSCPDRCRQVKKQDGETMKIIGDILADLQAQIDLIKVMVKDIHNQILPEEK